MNKSLEKYENLRKPNVEVILQPQLKSLPTRGLRPIPTFLMSS